jgi:hypothetical protein
VVFHCVEFDSKAIVHATGLNHAHLDRVRFIQKNALLYQPEGQYDLVWAAGIFDYFTDRVFVRLLRRLLGAVAPAGKVVVGNFSEENPTGPYMELVDWLLHLRGPDTLRALARQAGAVPGRVRIGSEAESVKFVPARQRMTR